MSRRWLITVSLLAHVGLGVGLFATGIWRLERLDGGRAITVIGVMTPPAPAPEGGPTSKFEAKLTPKDKPDKKIIKIAQPQTKTDDAPPDTTAANTGGGEGSAVGPGTGTGPVDSTGTCLENCGQAEEKHAVCGNGSREDGESCDDGNLVNGDGCSATCTGEPPKVAIVPPALMTSIRISGDTQIHPSDTDKTMMMRDGTSRTVGVLKVCVATGGQVSSVSIVNSTKYSQYDARLVAGVRDWRYRPYLVENRPTPFCGMVTFVYAIN
jgi:TonB family protein